MDFDLVAVDGRPLFVCVDFGSRVFSWDPLGDAWTGHALATPWRSDSEYDFLELLALGAVVVDGRIVVGGGAEHQSFTQWDLETGAVRTFAQPSHGGVARVISAEVDGRPLIVSGDSSLPATVRLWDASRLDSADEREAEAEDQSVPLYGHFDGIGGMAAGALDDRPVVVSGGWDGRVLLWDLREQCVLSEFQKLGTPIMGASLVDIDGFAHVVVGGHRTLTLGDAETGEWVTSFGGSPDAESDDEDDEDFDRTGISCLDVGLVGDVPVAVTGFRGGVVQLWNLRDRRPVGVPFAAHRKEVFAVRITELDGRPVIITAGRDGHVRVWNLEP